SQLSLNIVSLLLSLHDNSRAVQFSLHGRSDADVRRWLGDQLVSRGFDADALDRPSPYAIPARRSADDAPYDAVGLSKALTELAAWFSNANCSLEPIRS